MTLYEDMMLSAMADLRKTLERIANSTDAIALRQDRLAHAAEEANRLMALVAKGMEPAVAASVKHGNTGHGHVWDRPDGLKARCGGPGLCRECSRDQALVSR